MSDELRKESKRLLSDAVFQQGLDSEESYLPDHIDATLRSYSKVLKDKPFWEAFYKIHYPGHPNEYGYFTSAIDEFSVSIGKCFEAYYLGKISKAYSCLKEGLNKILYGTSKLFNDAVLIYPEKELNLYRIRVRKDSDTDEFGRKEMFHIPFNQRGKVSTQRYSIPGHPSLYLGDSIFVCWKELNQPSVKSIYASRYENSTELKVIEIKSVHELLEEIESLDGTELSSTIFRFLLLYPLTVASSIKVAERQDSFKPEYIVPQLFLQYILDEKSELDGIKYFSTRVETGRTNNVGTSNFVFPSKTNKKEGYCPELISKFRLTHPVLWEYEEINVSNATFLNNSIDGNKLIELYKGRKVPYHWTTFSAIEKTLGYDSFKLESLSET